MLLVAPASEREGREAAAEQERIAAVRKVCGDKHADIAAKAIAEGAKHNRASKNDETSRVPRRSILVLRFWWREQARAL